MVFCNFFRPITAINEDLGRHLLLGKIIFETQTIPHTNLLSYTNPAYPFINSHWLSEVIFFLISQTHGFSGLIIFATVITIITVGIIGFFVYKRTGLIPLIIAAFLYLPLLFERSDIRPELFSYLLVVIFITILYRYREHPSKQIFLLIPLQILWVNLHIYFFVGPLLISLFLFEYLWTKKIQLTSIKTLKTVFCLAIIGTLINPNGIQGAIFPFTVLQNYSFPVAENQNIFTLLTVYRQASIFFFLGTVLFLFLLLVITRRYNKLIDWFLVVTFVVLTCFAFRTITLFVYTTLIPFTSGLALILPKVQKRLHQMVGQNYSAILMSYALFILCLVFLSQLTRTLTQKGVGFGIEERGNKAVTFLLKNKLPEPIYNNFDIGSYLSYRIYPKKIFVDGRPEAYPKAFFIGTYLPMQTEYKTFTTVSKRYNFKTLIISHWDQTPWKNRLFINLLNDPSYVLVYLDDYALIFVTRTHNTQTIVSKYKINQKNFAIPKETTNDALIRYLYFFEKVGWDEQRNKVLAELAKRDPQNQTLNRYRNGLQHH